MGVILSLCNCCATHSDDDSEDNSTVSLEIHTGFHKHINLQKKIYHGSTGTVIHECYDRAIHHFACKIMPNTDKTWQELTVWKALSGHPGILELKKIYEDGIKMYAITELCSSDLITHVEKYGAFPERIAANIMKSLMLALQYCHDMGYVHRDVSLCNLLLTRDIEPHMQIRLLCSSNLGSEVKLKLADFGLAEPFEEGTSLKEVVGNVRYMAPEILRQSGYSKGVDIWSAGVCLYGLLCGKLPFGSTLNALDTIDEILVTNPDVETGIWKKISCHAKDLVLGMLEKDPKQRLKINQILRHPWMLEHTRKARKIAPLYCEYL